MIKYEKYLLHLMCYVHVLIMVFIVLPLFPAVNNKQKIIKMHTKVIYCAYLNHSKYLSCVDIEDKLDYKKWYCGHWHINKRIDKMEFLFHDVRLF